MVASRKCPHCGHSEIGYVTPDGSFHSLKPGTLITFKEPPAPPFPDVGPSQAQPDFLGEGAAAHGEAEPWVPAVLRGNPRLRVKYGVMAGERMVLKGLTSDEYRSAFLNKIENLIAKEVFTALPVLFDRFFSAPHLASGNPRQISQSLWAELEEIQKPVSLVSQWIEKQDEESLLRMIHPATPADLGGEPVSDEELEAELQSLTLEEFLERL